MVRGATSRVNPAEDASNYGQINPFHQTPNTVYWESLFTGKCEVVMNRSLRAPAILACMVWSCFDAEIARAVDIPGVLYAALDQPVINAYVATRAGGQPLTVVTTDDLTGGTTTTFTIQPYLDTGASGILLSD